MGALGLSRLSDVVGCSPLVVLGCLVYCGGLALAAWLKVSCLGSKAEPTCRPDCGWLLQHSGLPGPEPAWEEVSWIAYLAAFCFGIGDSLVNTQTYALIGKLFKKEETTRAFTVFQLYQNVGSAGGYYMGVPVPMHGANGSLGLVWVQLYLLVIGTGLFCWVERRYLKARSVVQGKGEQWDVN